MIRSLVVLAALSAFTVLAGCGDEKPADGKASAEPAKSAEPTPPPAATSAAPAASASAAPAESAAAAPEGSGKAEAGEKGKEGEKKGEEKGKEGEGGKEGDKVVHLMRAHLEFNKPHGEWTESKKGPWVLFQPKDKSSVLAFVEFEKPGEASARLGQIAESLDLKDVKWKGEPKKEKIGPDHLEAMHAEGTCKVNANKHDCEIEYYTVEAAVLIAYAAETGVKGGSAHEKVATKTVETMRKAGPGGEEKGEKKGPGGHGKRH